VDQLASACNPALNYTAASAMLRVDALIDRPGCRQERCVSMAASWAALTPNRQRITGYEAVGPAVVAVVVPILSNALIHGYRSLKMLE